MSVKKIFHSPWPYLIAWLLLNIWQGITTGLAHDEAYYWIYSTQLDWGYFDHPPMVALSIHFGSLLIEGTLGVRLGIALMSTATLWLLWDIVRPRRTGLFFLITGAIALVHVGGFFAAPDVPLVFFTAIFYWLARDYVDRDTGWLALALALTIAAMAYSKYQGAIILIFSLLAVPRLLKRKSFWMIILGATVLYLPHLYWQYAHDFVTFRYHLHDRMAAPFEWTFPLNYIGGQLLVFGPLISFLLFPAAWKKDSLSTYDRLMHFSLWGMLGVVLLLSLRGRVEPNWTAPVLVPLVYLGYRYLEPKKSWRRIGLWAAVASWVLLLGFRGWMGWNLPPENERRNEFHGWDQWADSVAVIAEDRPVVFVNTYQLASKYEFYTGGKGISLNDVSHPGNQYDLWPQREASYQGKEVLYFYGGISDADTFEMEGFDRTLYRIMPDFHSYNTVQCRLAQAPDVVDSGDTITLQTKWFTEGGVDVQIPPADAVQIGYLIMTPGHNIVDRGVVRDSFPIRTLKAGDEYPLEVKVPLPSKSGEYKYRLTLDNGYFRHLNMPFWMFEVEE